MKTITQPYLYNLSENVSDFLFEYLNDTNQDQDWTYKNQKIDNPKITFFEQRVAALEGGVEALAVKSFNKAKYLLFKTLVRPGENIVTFNSYSLFTKDKDRLSRAGIELKFSEDGSLHTFESLIDENTKLIYLETISPELLSIPDFQKVKFIARAWNIPVIVDNTAGAAGYITRPLKNGANIVVEKTSQWLPSHKGLIGGVIVDGGNYDWLNGKFPQLNNKIKSSVNRSFNDPSIHLLNLINEKGNLNIQSGSIPQDSLALIQDFDHLSTIVQRQSDNAKKLVTYLNSIEEVASVNYTGTPGNASYFKATTFFRNGFGPYLTFSLKTKEQLDQLKEYVKHNNLFTDSISFSDKEVYFTTPTSDYDKIEDAFEFFFNNRNTITLPRKQFNELNFLEAIF